MHQSNVLGEPYLDLTQIINCKKAIFEKNAEPSTQSHMAIWLIYMHVRQQEVWDNFERAIHLSLAPRRMKFFFKSYLGCATQTQKGCMRTQ